MKPEETPCSVVRRNDISSSRCLRDEAIPSESYPLLGGVFSDTKLSWVSRGPVLEIIKTHDGSIVARWTFGEVIKDLSTKITCIEEYNYPDLNGFHRPLSQVLVGLECELTGGMVCVFNFTGPRVLCAINIPSKVTSLALISPGLEVTSLHPSLEPMDGLVGVGTKEGHIFIIDLRRSDCENDLRSGPSSLWENLNDELRPCQLIPVRGVGADQRLKDYPNDHLCLHLNHTAFVHFKRFVVQFPRGDYKQFLPENSAVTSMLYVPGLSSLIVGFAFGSFQIWSLKTLSLLYTCPNGGGPVERLLFQEPCDDPNACCYVWVVRGSNLDNPNSNSPSVMMYTLSYDEKLWVQEQGNVFNNFISCNVAFNFEFDQDEDIAGGRVISMRTIDQPLSSSPSSLPDENTLGSSTSSLSLCLLVWETWGSSGPQEGLDPSNTHMAVFDLNQWYVDHMPARLSSRGGVSRNKMIAGYVAKYRLGETLCGEIIDGLALGTLVDVNIDPKSLLPFTTVQNVEEHSRPSALQFRSVALLEKQIVHIYHPGIQRALLSTLTSTGPSLLLTPTYIFHQCLALGLRPLHYEVPDLVDLEVVKQRSYVILVALEHKLTRWLSACARECSDGKMEGAGCTLAWFLNVLWSRLGELKQLAVQICVQLFDHSGEHLDPNASRQLRHIVAVVRVLKTLFDNVTKERWHLRLNDSHHIELQKQAVHMEVQYYEVLQWFIEAGLLPELPDSSSDPENGHVPYPAKNLVALYSARRTELQELYKAFEDQHSCEDVNDDVPSTLPQDLMMIDGLISHQSGGKRLQSEWERDAGRTGGRFANMYPPASIQGLLRTYLVRDISYNVKTSVVIYVFMDLAATLDTEKCASNLHRFMQFPSAFHMSPGQIKLTQAFWHLDRRAFEVALEMLLDPLVSRLDIEIWQHRSVVRALMLQGQHRLALRYLSSRQPDLNSDYDIRMKINLLLANDLVHEAYTFQKDHRRSENCQSLLEYFFKGSEKRQLLQTVLQLTLSEEEEKALVSFLSSNGNAASEHLHVMYLLKRFRYVEAFEVNQKLKKTALESGRAVGSFEDERDSTRDIVVNALFKTLPSVTRALANHCAQERNKVSSWRQVKRPTPLSVEVRHCHAEVKYRSLFMETAIRKTRDAWTKVLPKSPPDSQSFVENTPFLCTPRAKLFGVTKSASRSIQMEDLVSRKRSREEDGDLSSLPISKLSRSVQRSSISHETIDAAASGSTGVLTPIVKRQSPNSRLKSRQSRSGDVSKLTPHSIIKSRDSLGLTKSPLKMSAEASTSRISNRSERRILAETMLVLPDTPEHARAYLARRQSAPLKLDVELTDDEEDVNAQPDQSVNEKSVSAVKGVSDSVISNDLESDDEIEERRVELEPFALPSRTPSPAKTPASKRFSLSNMVVLSEARKKASGLGGVRWSANRSSVTFGEDSVCVYDKDEPASTATGSSELSQSTDEDISEKEREQTGRIDDGGNVNLSELRRSCHARAKPRPSVHPEISERSDENSVDSVKTDGSDDSVPDDGRERQRELVYEEFDFESSTIHSSSGFVRDLSSLVDQDVTDDDTNESIPDERLGRRQRAEEEFNFESSVMPSPSGFRKDLTTKVDQEVTDDDSNDNDGRVSEAKVHEEVVEIDEDESEEEEEERSLPRCALLSPTFRNQLVRKSINSSKDSLERSVDLTSDLPKEVVAENEDDDVRPSSLLSSSFRNQLVRKSIHSSKDSLERSAETEVGQAERGSADEEAADEQSDVSDSENLGEVSGGVAAESLISNDLDSEEEEEEEVQPEPIASKFWNFILPSRTPSPIRTPVIQKRHSLSNIVLLSETRKACHARVKPRSSVHPEVIDRFEDAVEDDQPTTSTPKIIRSAENQEENNVDENADENDFEVAETVSVNIGEAAVESSSESDEPKRSDDIEIVASVEVSDDESNDVLEQVEENIAERENSDQDKIESVSSDESVEPEDVSREEKPEEMDVEQKNEEPDSDGEMEELRVEDSGDESENVQEAEDPPTDAVDLPTVAVDLPTDAVDHPTVAVDHPTVAVDLPTVAVDLPTVAVDLPTVAVEDAEPCTPPNVAAALRVASSALQTPRSAKLSVFRDGDTPRSDKKSLRRTRLTESATFSGVRTRRGAQDPESTPTRGASPEISKSVDQVEQATPHRTRSSELAEDVEEKVKSARKTRSASVADEVEAQEGTPRRTRSAGVAKDVEVQEGTPRRTRGASVSKDAEVEGPARKTRGGSVVKEVEAAESTLRKTRGGSVAKEVQAAESTPRKARGGSVAKEVEAAESTPRKARGGSVTIEVQAAESTPRKARGGSVAKEVEAAESMPRKARGGSVAKEVEAAESTPRRMRGGSVAKEVEAAESTPRRTRGGSVAKEVEAAESTLRKTRGGSVAKEVEAAEGTPRRTRGGSVPKDTDVLTPRRIRGTSLLHEVIEEDPGCLSQSSSSSVIKEATENTPSSPATISSASKEEEPVTPRPTKSSAQKTSTPRQTRRSSVLKESEQDTQKLEDDTVSTSSKDDGENKGKRRGRRSSVAKELEPPVRCEIRGSTASQEPLRQKRSSSALKEDETTKTLVQTRSSSVANEDAATPQKRKVEKGSKAPTGTPGKSTRQSRRGNTSELDESFESKDGDTESNYSKRSNASPNNSPDSIASRVRSRLASGSSVVSSVESSRKTKRKSEPKQRKSGDSSNDTSLILQEKLAQISDSDGSTVETPTKKARCEVSLREQREGSVARSVQSALTERLHPSDSGSEIGEPGSSKKSQLADVSSRDRIEAAIQEYSSTRRLTRKQHALLSRSMEVSAQADRFHQTSALPAVHDEEDEDDRADTQSQSSVRSSVRLRKKKDAETRPSPTSSATTEILVNEPGDTPTRRPTRRATESRTGSPSSIASGVSEVSATRRKGRPSKAQKKTQLKEVEEESLPAKSTASTEIETSSQASSRKNLRKRSMTPDVEPHVFSDPQPPDSDAISLSDVSSVYRESFQFSQPENVEVQQEDSSGSSAPSRRARQSKVAPQPSLVPIREESRNSSTTEKDDDTSSTKSSSNDKRRSWSIFSPATEEAVAAARRKGKLKPKKVGSKSTINPLYSRRARERVFKLLSKSEEDSDD